MPSRTLRPTLALAAALALLAGCLGGEAVPEERTVSATNGRSSDGWAYDGVGVQPAGATLEGRLNNPQNTGLVTATFQHAGSAWTATFDTFAQAEGKTFQDGGIAFELVEHGDTGVADASIPRIHATIAAWGTAVVTRDGAPVGGAPWSAHLMVARESVRGPDAKIAKADGATPYDPAAPGDARRIEDDPQALMFLKHPMGETFAREPVAASTSLACAGPACQQTAEIPFETGAKNVSIAVTLTGQPPLPGGAGQGTLRLVDGAGAEVDSTTFTLTPQSATVVLMATELEGLTAPLTLELAGAGAYTASVDSLVSYDDVPFIVLTWDEVTVA